MIDRKNFFDRPINSGLKTYENIKKIATVKEIITRLVVCYIILTFKIITK